MEKERGKHKNKKAFCFGYKGSQQSCNSNKKRKLKFKVEEHIKSVISEDQILEKNPPWNQFLMYHELNKTSGPHINNPKRI